MKLPAFPEYVTEFKSRLAAGHIPMVIDQTGRTRELDSISYSMLDASIEEHWNYCAGSMATSRTWQEDREYFIKYSQRYINQLIKLLSQEPNNHREIAALFYFVYKLESVKQAVIESNQSTNAINLDAIWERQPAKAKQSFAECFKGRKTLHTVQVLDGTGDLIHFVNWFKEYCLHRDVNNTTVIISMGPRSSDKFVAEYLDNLDDTHPLKNHQDLTVCASSDLHHVLNGTIFASIVSGNSADSYCALYTISAPLFINVYHYLDIPRIGMPTCLINEMGYETCITRGLKRIPAELYEYSFGVGNDPRRKPIGFLFAKPRPQEKLETILTRLSDNLKTKLFGQHALSLNPAELLGKAQQVQIVCVYYTHDKSLKLLNNLLQKINNTNVVVFFSGTDELPPKYMCRDLPEETKHLKLTCGNLNKTDYADLMQLIRTDSRHFLLSSGDNSFAHSIATGKIPLYLYRTARDDAKKNAINNFLKLIYEIALSAHMDVKPYIAEIIQFLTTEAQAKIPSVAALDFFANKLSPFILRYQSFSSSLSDLLINVENNYQEDFRPITQPVADAWKSFVSEVESGRRRAITPMFMIRHYEPAVVSRFTAPKKPSV